MPRNNQRPLPRLLYPVCLSVTMLAIYGAQSAKAEIYHVTSTSDAPGSISDPLTLRGALAAAEADNDPTDTILVNAEGTISLQQGELLVTNSKHVPGKTFTIFGSPSGPVSGGNESRVFHISGARVILRSLTVTEGRTNGNGAGILIDPATHVTMYDCTVTSNTSPDGGVGGGIANAGDLSLYNTKVSNNRAIKGGGIFSVGGSLSATHCTVTANGASSSLAKADQVRGAGIYSANETIVLAGTSVSSNLGGKGYGGGIFSSGDTGTYIDCSIVENSAANGGGIYLESPSGRAPLSTTAIESSAIYNNHAGPSSATQAGGGIYIAGASVTLSNDTVAANSADTLGVLGHGAGIFNDGVLTIADCTISDNQGAGGGAGIYNMASVPSVISTILAGNHGGDIQNAGGSLISGGSNLIGDPDGNGFVNDPDHGNPASHGNHDQTGIAAANLSPVANNGGPTWTMALQGGSPAIDADFADSTPLDQRKADRLKNFGTRNDIGAFESNTDAPPVFTDNFFVTNTHDSGAGSLREAIDCANIIIGANINFDPIVFNPQTQKTITLANGQLVVNQFMNILGPGSNVLTIDGNHSGRVFDFEEQGGGTINGLTITGGDATHYSSDQSLNNGGGVLQRVSGSFLIQNCVITGNKADYGGGLCLQTAEIDNCVVSDNAATSAGGGIAAYSALSTVPLRRLTANNCTIRQNTAEGTGGGVFISLGSGAIHTSTISANSAGIGGGLYSTTFLTLNESTLSGNHATSWGGGVFHQQYMKVSYCTISDNIAQTGGGIYNLSGNSDVSTTIIAGNSNGNVVNNDGTITSEMGSNIIGDPDGNGFLNDPNHADPASTGDHTQTGVLNPLLAPLNDNGGPTQTMALLPNSPALDAAFYKPFTSQDNTDQRRCRRPAGIRLDAGAYEAGVPIADDDAYSAPQNQSLTTLAPGVLGNDHGGSQAAPLSAIENLTGHNHGILILGADGGFIYTPDTGFAGVDRYEYIVHSGASAGNTATIMFTVSSAPVTQATTSPTVPNGNNDYYTTPVQIILSTLAAGAPATRTKYSLDASAPRVYVRPFTISGDAEHTIQYGSISSLGVTEPLKTLTIKIDGTKPATAASTEPIGTAQRITLTAVDNFSGVAVTTYAVDAGPLQTYAGPFQIASSGRHTIIFHSVDVAGNVEDNHTLTIGEPGIAHTFAPGLQMLSVPADYSSTPLSSALGITNPILAQWLPSSGQYAVTPAAPADALRPGHGYWARFHVPADLFDVGTPTPTTAPFSISLSSGWNMIGDPFPASIHVGAMAIVDNSGVERTMTAAIAAKLIAPTLYSYPAGASQYQAVSTNDSLAPYLGYWIYATQPTTLKITPPL